MTITERDYPVLVKLKTKSLGKVDLFAIDVEALDKVKEFSKGWEFISLGINNQIYYISPEFAAAYERSGDSLSASNPFSQIEDDNICFLHANKMVTCMKLRNSQEKKMITCAVFCFDKDVVTTFGKYEISYLEQDNLVRIFTGWKSANVSNIEPSLFNCVLMTLYIENPEILKVKVPAGSFVSTHKNTSFMPVVILSVQLT